MVAAEFLDYLTKFKAVSCIGFEDFSDRMNFLFTVLVLLLSSLIVSVKQYIMRPISCYGATLPIGMNLINYIENYCWIQGTVPVHNDKPLPTSDETWTHLDSTDKIFYYQWVPFMLGIQCVLFYIPRVMWQIICSNYAGTDLTTLTQKAFEAQQADMDERDRKVENLAHLLKLWIFQRKNGSRHGGCFSCCFYSGVWLSLCYLVTKALYLTNSVSQLWLMQHFLGFGKHYNQSIFPLFGINLAQHIFTNRDWEITQVFPRVSYCRIPLRMLGPSQYYISQCVIPTNMLNEKIYIFLWFWISLTSIVNFYGLMKWTIPFVFPRNNKLFVRRLLNFCQEDVVIPPARIKRFSFNFLSSDGLFILRMIRQSSGDLISSEIIMRLWNQFLGRDTFRDPSEEEDEPSYLDNKSSFLKEENPGNKANHRNLYKRLPEFSV